MERYIPNNWILTNLGEIAKWGSGGTPSRSNSLYYNGSIPWIKTGELNDSIIYDTSEKITNIAIENSSAKIFPKGSIAIAMYGATIGKTGILGVDASTNQACAVAQPFQGILNKYLHYFLISEKQDFIEKGKGGAQPNISQTVIKKHDFLFAPINEQTRIVHKLDQLFSHLERLKPRLNSIPELLKQFRQAVLTHAVTGKLTEEWRTTAKQWTKMKVGDFMTEVKDKSDPMSMPEVNYIGLEHIEIGGKLLKVGSSIGLKSQKSVFKKGDVLYGKLRPYLDKHIVTEFDGICSTDILIYRNDNENSSKFFNYFLGDPNTVLKANTESKGINLPRVSAKIINSFDIEIPPSIEQKEIVKEVESLFSKVDNIEKYYKTLEEQIENLPQTILAKAFRGELVEQDDNDEPAEILLERIKQSREKIVDNKVQIKKKPIRKKNRGVAKSAKSTNFKKESSSKLSGNRVLIAGHDIDEDLLKKFLEAQNSLLYKMIEENFSKKDFLFENLFAMLKLNYNALWEEIQELLHLTSLGMQPGLSQKYSPKQNRMVLQWIKSVKR